MAYRLELGQDLDEGFYLELAIRNRNNGGFIDTTGVDHRLVVLGWAEDYGRYGRFGQVVASNGNGMITAPTPGIVCINVPVASLLFGGNPAWCQEPAAPILPAPPLGGGPTPPALSAPVSPPYAPFFAVDAKISLRFKLLAVPANPLFTKTIVKGTISFGGPMPNPRLTLDAYPLYPNSPTANIAVCEVQQIKQQLAQLGLYDKVEAGLTGGPTSAATIAWSTGGMMSFGGPLSNAIQAALGYGPSDMVLLINAANLVTI